MKVHEMKLSPFRFIPMAKGENHVLLVNGDEAYEVGDPVVLLEYDPDTKELTGRNRLGRVTFLHSSLDVWNNKLLAPGTTALSVRVFREPRSI